MFVVNLLSYQKRKCKGTKKHDKIKCFRQIFRNLFFAFLSVLHGSIVQEN